MNFAEKFIEKKYNEHYDLEIIRRRKHTFENQDKIKNYRCDYREKTKEYVKNKKKSDLNFKIDCDLRSRTSSAINSQNVRKISKTFNLFGCSLSFFQRWIIHQLYGNMTIENYGKNWYLDH